MVEVVAADGEAVAVAAEQKDVQVGPGQADTGGQWDSATMDEVGAVAVDEIGEARGAADARKGDDFFVLDLAFLEDFVIAGEDGEIAATRTPRRVIGGEFLVILLVSSLLEGRLVCRS